MAEPFFEDEALGKAYDSRLMRRLLGYLKPYRWVVAGTVALLLILSLLQVAGPWIIKHVIDGPIAGHDREGLLYWIGVFVGIMLLQFVVQFAHMILSQWIGQRAMLDLRTEIFEHMMAMGMRFFDRNPVGRLLTRVTGDVNTLSEMFSSGVVTVFGDVFTLLAIVGAMLYLNTEMALITFLVLPLLVVATLYFKHKVRFIFREVRRLVARLNAYWQERVTGIAVVQWFNQEEWAFNRHQELNADLRSVHLRSVLYYAIFFPVAELIGALSLALIIWYGGGKVLSDTLSFGALVAFIQYAERFYSPIRDLAEKYNILQGAMASSERVFKLLDTEPNIAIPENPWTGSDRATSDPARGAVVFENVWFAYEDENWVLQDVSFTIAPGETVAIVGATGAGKTSIANLITRLYEFQRGTITVDGIDVRCWDQVALRRHVGTTSQEVFLFSGAVADNIRLDSVDLSDEKIQDSARRVGVDRLLSVGENGATRTVGERGSGLSVGEKQLVAFARAIAFDPGILILDEATASVDHRTEARIQEALGAVFKGRTNIVIAHRLSTIRAADRIIVLHKGKLREVGNHDVLMAKDGIYARLYRLQAEADADSTESETRKSATPKA